AYIRPPDNNTLHEQTSAATVRKRVTETGEVVEEVVAPVYFPGTFDVQAARLVTVRTGDNLQGYDIKLPEMPAARRIKGTVIDGVTGQPATSGVVRAFLANTGPAIAMANGAIGGSGNFELSGVTSGTYFLFAVPGATGGFLGGRAGKMIVQIG